MADLVDIALDSNMDLYQDPYTRDFVLIYDKEALAQRLRIRFGTQLGEYFLDLSLGLPYLEEIMIKNYDLGLIRARIQAIVLDTPFVTGLRDLTLSVGAARQLTVTMTIETEFGPLVAESAPSTVYPWMLVLMFPGLGAYLN